MHELDKIWKVNALFDEECYFELQNLKFQTGEFNKDLIALKRGGKNYRKFTPQDQILLEKFWFRKFVDVIGSKNPFKRRIRESWLSLTYWDFETVNMAFCRFHNTDYGNQGKGFYSDGPGRLLREAVNNSDELRWLLDEYDDLETFWKTEVLDKTEKIWTLEELTEAENKENGRLREIMKCFEKTLKTEN